MSTNARCCHVIPFWSGPRRSTTGSGYAIELLKFIWETHTNIDGGMDFDVIILNPMYDNEETNSFLSEIDGTKTKNGKFIVYNKDNIGWGFGSHAYAYEKLRNEYDYWFFTEDDNIFCKPNWYKNTFDLLVTEMNNGSNVAFIASKGVLRDSGFEKSQCAHGGMGITHKKFLDEIYYSEGGCSDVFERGRDSYLFNRANTLPYYAIDAPASKPYIIWSEIEFTNVFFRLGYEIGEIDEIYYKRWFVPENALRHW